VPVSSPGKAGFRVKPGMTKVISFAEVSEYAVEVEAPFSRNARFAKKAETFRLYFFRRKK